jgi:hypothetical protein
MWADNTCDFCAEGLQASRRHGGQWGDEGVDGGQGEAVRVPQAQDTQVRHEGHIWAGGIDKDVTFAEADPDINDTIDAAYRDKYRGYGPNIVGGVVNPEARAATIKLVPR